jgi:hypothetical protein
MAPDPGDRVRPGRAALPFLQDEKLLLCLLDQGLGIELAQIVFEDEGEHALCLIPEG